MKTTAREDAQFINRTVLASTISALLAGGGAAQAQESGLEEITVTGSRIVRRDLDAASPIVTIDSDRLENSSTIGIESVLNQMPQFVPEGTQFDSGNTASGAATLGIASVNLRGIGANRTLVLVDGRRAQPANASLVVDLNTIPSAAIERVETITGGASAVYGADALAGVVNFVLRDDFEGVDMDFHTGVTAEGDGEETRFSTLLGINGESGNSNVMLGVEWYRREAVYQIDREFFTQRVGRSDQPDRRLSERVRLLAGCRNSAPRWPRQRGATDRVRPERPDPSCDQRVVRALRHRGGHRAAERRHLLPAGWPAVHLAKHSGLGGRHQLHRPAPELRQQRDGTSGVRVQPNGALAQVGIEAFAATPAERRSVFGRAHLDLNDNLSAFAQATYSNIEVATRGGYPPAITVWQAQVPNDGLRPIPAGLQQLLNGRPRPTEPWNAYRGLDYLGGPIQPTSQTDAYQLMAGVEGSFANRDWTWEAYVSTGETNITMLYDNLPSLQRYQFLMAQPNWGVGTFVRGRNYEITCGTGLPMFTTTDPDPGCVEGIESNDRALWDLTQNIVEANLQGKIADMRNGELRFATGVAMRENKFRYDPGTNNDNVAVVEQPLGIFLGNNTAGSTDVSELYGELLIPTTERLGHRARLSLLGLRHGGRRQHLQDAVRLLGDRECPAPRRLSVRDARAEHGGAVRRSALADRHRLHLWRPVPGLDDRDVG